MRALQLPGPNRLDGLALVDLPRPAPPQGGVVVEIKAASLNPSDVKNALGAFPDTTWPRIPGRDFAGVVVAGPATLVGAEVWGAGGDLGFTVDGTHAEFIALPAAAVALKPAGLSFVQAAAAGIAYSTAWLGLFELARLQPGERVFVTGASGAVGSAVAAIARWAGAEVVPAGPADVVFDCVGGAQFEPALNALAPRGRQVAITSVGERRVSFDLLDFYHRRLTLLGLDTRACDAPGIAGVLRRLAPGFASGGLAPPRPGQIVGLEDAPRFYRALAAGERPGKIVITP